MSRGYEIRLNIAGIAPTKGQPIVDAITPLWTWDDPIKLDADAGTINVVGVDDESD